MCCPLKKVLCAISGGVDSAISAFILKKRGFKVTGVFMKNWDQLEENAAHCSYTKDRNDAYFVCTKLGLEFKEYDFVKDYWSNVFEPTLDAYKNGLTPNPDILCNRHIKFNVLVDLMNDLGADAFATGHYARNSFGNTLELAHKKINERPKLLRSLDPVKDQTFWLCGISDEHLQHCMFPIGNLLKSTVIKMAREIGLDRISSRRESMGMCFIGKRRFRDFIDEYIEPRKGLIKIYNTNEVLGEHTGIHHFTVGQRVPGITRGQKPFYIAKMIQSTQDIFVVNDSYHPALFMKKFNTGPAAWISRRPPKLPSKTYSFQWQNKWRSMPVEISVSSEDYGNKEDSDSTCLSVVLKEPMRCIMPGQWAVIYDEKECLGGAVIRSVTSLADEGINQSYLRWRLSNHELTYSSIRSDYM